MSVIPQENGVRTRSAAIVNHSAVLKIVRVVNLLRVVFLVRRGPLGALILSKNSGVFLAKNLLKSAKHQLNLAKIG